MPRKRHIHARQHGRTFTLVELLVVITIISILAGLLLPALSRAREQAKAMSCGSNEKQLGTATVMYTNDFGRYPEPALLWNTPAPGIHQTWTRAMIEGGYMKRLPHNGATNPNNITLELKCPSSTIYTSTIGATIANSYLMTGDNPGFTNTTGIEGKRPAEVRIPSQTISHVENGSTSGCQFTVPDHRYLPGGNLANRLRGIHTRSFNSLFCDSHVKLMRYAEFDGADLADALNNWFRFFEVVNR